MRNARRCCLTIMILALVGVGLAQPKDISLWFHGGVGEAANAVQAYIEEFNELQSEYRVIYTEIPGGAVAGSGYNDAVNAAAVAGNLPCLLDLDGPFLYNYAWAGFLHPLDDFLSPELRADFLPSLIDQGLYNGKLYALGQYDSGLALVSRRSLLEQAGVRIPTGVGDEWSLAEFDDALAKIQALDEVTYAIDLKMNYGAGEWFTYGFSPVLQSWGADLIDRDGYQEAEGILNGEAAVEAMTWIQSLFENGYTTLTPPDDNEFVNGRAGIGWFGHWMAPGYLEAFGDDLVVIPMPSFGDEPVTGMGSWAWSITSACPNKEGAWSFLEYIFEPDNILRMVDAEGTVPGRTSALAMSDVYGEDGVLQVLVDQLQQGVAVPRPKTPAYPTITAAFYTAMDNILKGGDVQTELDIAVDKIEADIRANDGYR